MRKGSWWPSTNPSRPRVVPMPAGPYHIIFGCQWSRWGMAIRLSRVRLPRSSCSASVRCMASVCSMLARPCSQSDGAMRTPSAVRGGAQAPSIPSEGPSGHCLPHHIEHVPQEVRLDRAAIRSDLPDLAVADVQGAPGGGDAQPVAAHGTAVGADRGDVGAALIHARHKDRVPAFEVGQGGLQRLPDARECGGVARHGVHRAGCAPGAVGGGEAVERIGQDVRRRLGQRRQGGSHLCAQCRRWGSPGIEPIARHGRSSPV